MKMIWQKICKANLPKITVPSIKHGEGNIMSWGWFCSNDTENLVRIRSIMTAENYTKTLNENLNEELFILNWDANSRSSKTTITSMKENL